MMEVFQEPRFIRYQDIPRRMAETLRPPTNLQELEYHEGGGALLWKPDMDVLLDVILMTLNSLPKIPLMGSLAVLWGYDGGTDWVVKSNLTKGARDDTREHVAAVTEQALKVMYPIHKSGAYLMNHSASKKTNCKTLLLAANRGNFAITTRFNDRIKSDERERYEIIVTLAIAQTLVELRPQDRTLQDSMRFLHETRLEKEHYRAYYGILSVVRNLFEFCEIPSIRFWRETYEREASYGLGNMIEY